jgi:hypothetical protein
MTIFVLMMPTPQPALAQKVQAEFNGNSLSITDTQWLISASGTAQEVSTRLGITDPTNPSAQPVGVGIVFATSGYFGRAPSNIWEWLKAKLEAPPPATIQVTASATNAPSVPRAASG